MKYVIECLGYDGKWEKAVNWKTKEPVMFDTAEAALKAAGKMPPFGYRKARVRQIPSPLSDPVSALEVER